MGFFKRFVWIFVSPSRVFDDLREGRTSWWQPWIWSSLIYMVAAYLALPVQRAVLALNPKNLPPEQLDKQIEVMSSSWMKFVQLGLTPVTILVVGIIMAGITYIVVTLLSSRANFKQYFSIIVWAGIIGSVSLLLSNTILRLRGVDAIHHVSDAEVGLGLGFLAGEEAKFLHAILANIDLFVIWTLLLIGMGLMRVFGMTRRQAVWAVIPWWVIGVLMRLVGSALGGVG